MRKDGRIRNLPLCSHELDPSSHLSICLPRWFDVCRVPMHSPRTSSFRLKTKKPSHRTAQIQSTIIFQKLLSCKSFYISQTFVISVFWPCRLGTDQSSSIENKLSGNLGMAKTSPASKYASDSLAIIKKDCLFYTFVTINNKRNKICGPLKEK